MVVVILIGPQDPLEGLCFNSNPVHYYNELIVMRNRAIKLILIRIVTTRGPLLPLFIDFPIALIIFGFALRHPPTHPPLDQGYYVVS